MPYRSRTTGSPCLARGRSFRIDEATAGSAFPVQHPVNYRRSASNPGLNGHGADWTIETTGPAFHAGIACPDPDTFFIDRQHPMGADLQAHTATGAFITVNP